MESSTAKEIADITEEQTNSGQKRYILRSRNNYGSWKTHRVLPTKFELLLEGKGTKIQIDQRPAQKQEPEQRHHSTYRPHCKANCRPQPRGKNGTNFNDNRAVHVPSFRLPPPPPPPLWDSHSREGSAEQFIFIIAQAQCYCRPTNEGAAAHP